MQPFTVQQRHAVVHVEQADIVARHLVARYPIDGFLIDAVAGILHRNLHPIALIFHRDHHHPFPLAGLDAVHDGVLHQRLDQQARNAHRDVVVDVVNHRQLGAEARLFDGDIVLNLMQLLADIDQFVVQLRVVAQVARQVNDQLARGVRIQADRGRDGVQRVEQEVRVNLALQRAHFGFICHLAQVLDAGHFHLRGDDLRQPDRHHLQRVGDLVGVAVVNFQRAGHFAFFPQRHHQLRMDSGAAGFSVLFLMMILPWRMLSRVTRLSPSRPIG